MIPLAVLAAAIVMMAVESAAPGRRWPAVAGWWTRSLFLNGAQALVVLLAGIAWEPWMRAHRPWSANALGPFGGAVAGYLAVTFVYYWWHRWRHEVPLLWRWCHQLHHSPQRIEILTSFYKHPLELVANGVLSSAILYLGVGLGPQAAASAVLLTGLAELFYHWNVATPYWLGFLVQRPESHCLHHQAGLHRWNYADLPLWDMLFGTFRNPRRWSAACGFGGDEHRLGEMLRGIDLTPAVSAHSPKTGNPIVLSPELAEGSKRDERAPCPRPAPVRGPFLALILFAAGMMQMAGEIAGSSVLRGLGAASAVAPAPKVFSTVRGLETFSSRFVVERTGADGALADTPVGADLYAKLRGPYARRNVYGAALAYGPVLADDDRTRALGRAVVRSAVCGESRLLRELGIPGAGTVRVRVVPRPGMDATHLPLVLGGSCR